VRGDPERLPKVGHIATIVVGRKSNHDHQRAGTNCVVGSLPSWTCRRSLKDLALNHHGGNGRSSTR
jgi:hypothetical protein